VPSTTVEEGFQNLQEVLNALASCGFSLNYEKWVFFAPDTEYLGMVLSACSVRSSSRKVRALTATPSPTDLKGVRQFMSLAGYFRRFLAGFSVLTAPITQLLRKNEPFQSRLGVRGPSRRQCPWGRCGAVPARTQPCPPCRLLQPSYNCL
jgi:hypothetical protein